MESILEELWYENVCPRSVCREASEEEKKLIGYIADHHKDLWETLTDKQRKCSKGLMSATPSLPSAKSSRMRFGLAQEWPLRL